MLPVISFDDVPYTIEHNHDDDKSSGSSSDSSEMGKSDLPSSSAEDSQSDGSDTSRLQSKGSALKARSQGKRKRISVSSDEETRPASKKKATDSHISH